MTAAEGKSLAHGELHLVKRIGWLRAAVLGANDGIVSTASLIVGVASAKSDSTQILLAGIAGIVAGSMSMAAGEYVSVSSQSDTEKADIEREKRELQESPQAELQELTQIYIDRGLTAETARAVALELTAHDALEAHTRDELGISEMTAANPLQAAITSALTFAAGAALPLLTAIVSPAQYVVWSVSAASLISLAALGAIGARAGGAKLVTGAIRVTFWGLIAMALTAAIGALFGTTL